MRLLGSKTALERVAAFLHQMGAPLTTADVMSLPMSRRNIADYLLDHRDRLTAVSQLHNDGVLAFVRNTQREIMIPDRQQLASFDPQS
ncbi:helix-turn-helix domain-containing protein [Bradyrhizobium yuanmingense]|uniref:helix-turn-helix domain-containing protein n=1 Tax=Bradyrhizobium yuanmingense TaxID=108015 RepID=UPI0021A34FCC|nr:helix-turn-helix domain-containing protein [Bradyrhizobium sp. CB1024]UWU83267.1 helix-turn-helix domain-containing protein [Bradyrhizobium sp. CB1024]